MISFICNKRNCTVQDLPNPPHNAAGSTRVQGHKVTYKVARLNVPQFDSAIVGTGHHKSGIELQAGDRRLMLVWTWMGLK